MEREDMDIPGGRRETHVERLIGVVPGGAGGLRR